MILGSDRKFPIPSQPSPKVQQLPPRFSSCLGLYILTFMLEISAYSLSISAALCVCICVCAHACVRAHMSVPAPLRTYWTYLDFFLAFSTGLLEQFYVPNGLHEGTSYFIQILCSAGLKARKLSVQIVEVYESYVCKNVMCKGM